MLSLINRSLYQPCAIRKTLNSTAVVIRNYSQNTDNIETEVKSAEKGGFAKAFEKFNKPEESKKEPDLPFATLFKNSKFVEVCLIIHLIELLIKLEKSCSLGIQRIR